VKTARKPPKEKKPLESAVLKQCMATFERLGIKPYRRNVSAMFGEYKGKKWAVRSGSPGQSDIWAVLDDGRHVECEIKRPGEKPSLAQIGWLIEMNTITGAAFWVDSHVVLENILKALMSGGRVIYMDGKCSYPNPVKGCKGSVSGPECEFDVEVPDYSDN
jgi:hypothetical protein